MYPYLIELKHFSHFVCNWIKYHKSCEGKNVIIFWGTFESHAYKLFNFILSKRWTVPSFVQIKRIMSGRFDSRTGQIIPSTGGLRLSTCTGEGCTLVRLLPAQVMPAQGWSCVCWSRLAAFATRQSRFSFNCFTVVNIENRFLLVTIRGIKGDQ